MRDFEVMGALRFLTGSVVAFLLVFIVNFNDLPIEKAAISELEEAVCRGDAKELLRLRAKPVARENLVHAFQLAGALGDQKCCGALLSDLHPDEMDAATEGLLLSAASGHLDCIKTFLRHGVDVSSAHQRTGYTPLHFAVFEGQAEATKLLLEEGANPNARTLSGLTPLEACDLYIEQHGAKRKLPESYLTIRSMLTDSSGL